TGAADNDLLDVTGGTFTTVTQTFTTGPGHSGTIVYTTATAAATVSYTGLGPVDMTGSTITDLVFNLPDQTPPAGNNAVLDDNLVPTDNISQLRSGDGLFGTTTFTNPTGSLTINGGTGDDTITVSDGTVPGVGSPFDSGTVAGRFHASLTIDG